MQHCNYREWGEIFDQRMKIRRQVMEVLGISLPRDVGDETREALRRSMINCVACNHTQSCLDWLQFGDAENGPPDFCPNKEVFLFLGREAR